jgi:transcriptional regulator with XRE-family HTH domain
MKKQLPISLRKGLKGLGESLKKARLRRRLKMVTVADRAGISRETLAKIQRGDPGVGIGNYAAVIFALGLGTDWMNLADITEDVVGQALDEERLPTRVRETGV